MSVYEELEAAAKEHSLQYTQPLRKEEEVLEQMATDGWTPQEQMDYMLAFLARHPQGTVTESPFIGGMLDRFSSQLERYILAGQGVENFLAMLDAHPIPYFVALLLRLAAKDPDDPMQPEYHRRLIALLNHPALEDSSKKYIAEYFSTLPEVRPIKHWQPLGFLAEQVYTSQLRKVERRRTLCFRSPYYKAEARRQNLTPKQPVQSVSSVLMQKNQYTSIGGCSKPLSLSGVAENDSRLAKSTAVATHFIQWENDRYWFSFSIARKGKMLLDYRYTSQMGRWHDRCKAYGRQTSLSDYLAKCPEEWVLDEEMGKKLRLADIRPIFERVERGDNDWVDIFQQMEPLLYGRCRPLEWPDFTMKTPSTCPEGYTRIDAYVPEYEKLRMEIYYKTADMADLPPYKR